MWISFKSNLLATLRTSLHFSTELNMSININRGKKTYCYLVDRVIIFLPTCAIRKLSPSGECFFNHFSDFSVYTYIKYSCVGLSFPLINPCDG